MAVQSGTDQVQELIDRLAKVKPATGFPVLSLYLDTRPNQNGRDQFQAFVRKELKARRAAFESADLMSFDRDVEKIQEWLGGSLDPAANGAAIFACDGLDLFETVQLDVPIEESRLHVGGQPHVYTLARVLDLYPRYAALVTDTNYARIYVFGLGARLRETVVQSEKLTRTDAGGWSQMHYQRHVDNHRSQHAKEVMEALERIVRSERVQHVVLSGDEVALRWLHEHMPKVLEPKVVDMLQLDVKAPEHEVLQATLEALRRHEAKTDVERVQRLVDDFRAGGLAVAGPRETEAALALGQAHEVLISSNPTTVRVVDEPAETGPEQQVELCDRLVAMARQTDARVHFVEDPALLAGVGGVGALLRYRLDVESGDARLA